MNMFAKFDEIPSMILQDIKDTKCNRHMDGGKDRRTDNVKIVYPSTNTVFGGYNNTRRKNIHKLATIYYQCPI